MVHYLKRQCYTNWINFFCIMYFLTTATDNTPKHVGVAYLYVNQRNEFKINSLIYSVYIWIVVCLLRAKTGIFIHLYINHLDVSHCIAHTMRLELPDSLAEAGSMSLKQLACLPASYAELKWVSVRIQWPPVCNTTPGLAEATEHGGTTVIHSMRFEAVMEMVMKLNDSVFKDTVLFNTSIAVWGREFWWGNLL